jgi:predicted MFS family arabinose efflux permease
MRPPSARPLVRQRDFQLLWIGQVVSGLGSRVSGIALPLLVLALTGSPAKAGVAEFAYLLPILCLTLPAGALIDRWSRKRLMLAADAARCLAVGSLAGALAAGRATFGQIVVVAAVEGTGFTFFTVAQRASLRQLVPTELLPAAAAQNQAREYMALLAGQPLGGFLFSLGRVVPWAFDAVSYLVSLVTLLLIRRQLEEAREPVERHLRREIVEGVRFLWSQPFLRATSLLVAGSDLVVNALFLAVIVIAREHGASPTAIGGMVALIGVAGLFGSLVAPRLARRLTIRQTVVLTMTVPALLVPLLAIVRSPLLLGLAYAGMFVLHPTWGAVVGTYRLLATPDRLRGRVESVLTLLSVAPLPLGALAVGFTLEALGGTTTVAVLAGVMAAVAVGALVAPTPPS